MPDILSLFLYFTSQAFIFLIAEFIEWSIFVHDDAGWHFRFGSPEGHPNLRPLISTLKAALILFAIILVISPFLLPEVWNRYIINLVGSSKYWFLLFFLSITFSLLWIWHHVVGKDWNWQQSTLAVVSALLFAAYILLNFL